MSLLIVIGRLADRDFSEGLPYPSLEVGAPDIRGQFGPAGRVFGEGEHGL
jgi:hypothetical protein